MSSKPYESFAHVYEQENHVQVVTGFAAALRKHRLLTRDTGHVIELGCGDGLLLEMLLRDAGRVTGIDGSRAMVRLAQRRCRRFGRRLRLICRDFRRLPELEPGRLAVACSDVVNHLRPSQVRHLMRAADQVLQPGGRFAFDALNRFCFETYWDKHLYYLEGPGGDLVMDCSWDAPARRGTARMVAYAKNGQSRYHKRVTLLHEYLHDDQAIRTALIAAGFTDVRAIPWSPWPDQHLEPSLDRTFWIATKSK